MSDARLRIAHFSLGRVNREAADGIDKTIYYLSRAQAELGHSVRLFSITSKPPIPIPGVTISAYRSREPWRILFNRRLQDLLCWRSPLNLPEALIGDLLAWRPDILHFHGVHILQHVRLGSRITGAAIPYCISVHGMLAAAARRRHRVSKSIAGLWERPLLRRAAFLHALNEQEAHDLRSHIAAARIVIAPNGIDAADLLRTASGNPEPSPRAVEKGLTFLFLGRLDPEQKGLDMLIEAWSEARLGDWRGSCWSVPAGGMVSRGWRRWLDAWVWSRRWSSQGPPRGRRKSSFCGTRRSSCTHPDGKVLRFPFWRRPHSESHVC